MLNHDHIELTNEGVTLDAYYYDAVDEMPHSKNRPAVVVCPGGGYVYCSEREAEPIAMAFSGKGFNTFVLRYSLNENAAYPAPLLDISEAMKYIRENADKFHIDKNRIAVIGFSAGGHVAAMLSTLWNDPEIQKLSGCLNDENKPNAAILCYPVTTPKEGRWMATDKSVERLIGSYDKEKGWHKLNTPENVGKHTPPTFLMHTSTDTCVPIFESLEYATALKENNISFDMRVYSYGPHGVSLAMPYTNGYDRQISGWFEDAVTWLYRLFGRADLQSFYNDSFWN